jgi:hypothetical protein
MKPEALLPSSQKLAIGPCPKPCQYSPHFAILSKLMIHFNIVLPCMLRFSKASLSFMFARHIFYRLKFIVCPVRAVCIGTRTAGITAQQMWFLLKKFNPSSPRRSGAISRHINCLGTKKKIWSLVPTEP